MSSQDPRANRHDRAVHGRYEAREADWRNGAIVYQVLVDRFAPSSNLEAKRHLYPAPKRLRDWSELPTQGQYLEDVKVWSHEIDFWGGDLASTRAHLDHVQRLGVDVLYLNPICSAYTNHKYDALDYQQVSPEYGTRDDVKALAADLHGRGMKLVLDGVFNHMGRNAPIFQQALADAARSVGGGRHRSETDESRASLGGTDKPRAAPWAQEVTPGEAGFSSVAADVPSAAYAPSPYRDWFDFNPAYPGGVRCWYNAQNLPELVMEHPAAREHLYAGPDSVVRSYLRDGIDGWRLDVAHDIGFNVLEDLTQHAHDEKPGSLVVGELWTYPQEWFPSVDGVMNFSTREIILRMVQGKLPVATAARMLNRLIADAGVDNLLKSWLMLDNHDTPRLATTVPDPTLRRLTQLLQFTLPGAPNLYYGSELGMTGGDDPGMRAPMRWDLVHDEQPDLQWTRQLIALRKAQRALRVGDFRLIEATRLLAFERHTDRIGESVFVIANPSHETVTEVLLLPNSKVMSNAPLRDLLAPGSATPNPLAALLEVTLPPGGVRVLQPDVTPITGYSTYKRVQ